MQNIQAENLSPTPSVREFLKRMNTAKAMGCSGE